jgi:hypothetical protein
MIRDVNCCLARTIGFCHHDDNVYIILSYAGPVMRHVALILLLAALAAVAGGVETPNATLVSAGESVTCAIDTAYNGKCWGESDFLGANGVEKKEWIELSVGSSIAAGLASDNTFWTWGYSTLLSSGAWTLDTTPIQQGVDDDKWVQVTAGVLYACGIALNQSAYCYGENGSGQLGNGNEVNSTGLVSVSGGLSWRQLSAGRYFTCGILTNGSAACWGINFGGELGNSGPSSLVRFWR